MKPAALKDPWMKAITELPSSRRPRRSKFRRHVKVQNTIVKNEFWFGDEAPHLGVSFTTARAQERGQEIVQILVRAAKKERRAGNRDVAMAFRTLAKKLKGCRPAARCGSLACPMCGRAFQKAKVAAQERLIGTLQQTKPGKILVMATLVPRDLEFSPDELSKLNIQKANRWFKDILRKARIRRVMLGSADISWESGFYQLHWHVARWTTNRENLSNKLKKLFPQKGEHSRPVVVHQSWSLGFLGYVSKAIELPELLRRNRKHLPKLLVVLDRTEPMDLMILTRVRIKSSSRGFVLKPIGG
jgi:hypothetical protein